MSDLEIRESTLGGKGLYTRRAISAGQVVCEFHLVREVSSRADLIEDTTASPDHCTFVDGKIYLVGSPERYLNHSCDPLAYTRFEEARAFLVALKDIPVDGELTTDYLINNEGGDSWSCSCGSDRCRKTTGVSFFTLPLAFQQEYAPLLAPWFVRRNAEMLRRLSIAPAV